jgi:hypothetical protein
MAKVKTNTYLVIFIVVIVLIVGAYYSYLDIERARKNGVYTVSIVTKERPARNGWKVYSVLWYHNRKYEYRGVVNWEVFSFKDKSKRFFAKITEEPTEGYWPVFILEVPDSILSAPDSGWSEEWMKGHFPEVVSNVHDAR